MHTLADHHLMALVNEGLWEQLLKKVRQACEKDKNWQKALDLLQEMTQQLLTRDVVI